MGIDGYAAIVQSRLMTSPLQQKAFCFCNGRHNRLKILYWDGTGFWLLYKRLEKGTFRWPSEGDSAMKVTRQQMRWLLEGLDPRQKRAFLPSRAEYV